MDAHNRAHTRQYWVYRVDHQLLCSRACVDSFVTLAGQRVPRVRVSEFVARGIDCFGCHKPLAAARGESKS